MHGIQNASYIDVETTIDSITTQITGITQEEVERAPKFSEVKDELLGLLQDTIFVAHNVGFDYGFIVEEFRKELVDFHSDRFCTVEFSRLALFELMKIYEKKLPGELFNHYFERTIKRTNKKIQICNSLRLL